MRQMLYAILLSIRIGVYAIVRYPSEGCGPGLPAVLEKAPLRWRVFEIYGCARRGLQRENVEFVDLNGFTAAIDNFEPKVRFLTQCGIPDQFDRHPRLDRYPVRYPCGGG